MQSFRRRQVLTNEPCRKAEVSRQQLEISAPVFEVLNGSEMVWDGRRLPNAASLQPLLVAQASDTAA